MGLSDDISEATDSTEKCDPLPATPYLWLETPGVAAGISPRDHDMDGEIRLYASLDRGINVGVEAKDSDVELNAGFYLSPGDAERLASLLEEFAAKAREGTEWIHP